MLQKKPILVIDNFNIQLLQNLKRTVKYNFQHKSKTNYKIGIHNAVNNSRITEYTVNLHK